MVFPTTPILDDFTRANENPLSDGGRWTTSAFWVEALALVSNSVRDVDADFGGSVWDTSYGPDFESYVTVSALPTATDDGTWVDLMTAANPASPDGYEYGITKETVGVRFDLYRLDAGAYTTLLTMSGVLMSAGDAMGVRRVGSAWTCYVRLSGTWTPIGGTDDGTHAAALFPQMACQETAGTPRGTIHLDDFGGGTISPPSNATIDTATVIGALDYSTTQDVRGSGTAWEVWYTYTPVLGDTVLGLWGRGDFGDYNVRVRVWTGPTSAPVSYLSLDAIDKVMYFPVVAGTPLYFSFVPQDTTADPADLEVSLIRAPEAATVPSGTLLISDDEVGFPLTFVSATDGSVLRYVNGFSSGDYGETLPSNLALFLQSATTVRLWQIAGDPFAVTLVATVTLPWSVTGQFAPISSNRVDTFYTARGGTNSGNLAHVTTVSDAGVLGPTIWILAQFGVQNIAPSLDETILYFTKENSTTIFRHDLVNDVPLSNLATMPIGGLPSTTDLKLLSDGTILVGTSRLGVSAVYRYDAAGTLLNTYNTWSGAAGFDKLVQGLDDPASFWVRVFTNSPSGFATYYHFATETGILLDSFTQPFFNPSGIYAPTATASPAARFGASESCPLVLLYGPPPPPPCPGRRAGQQTGA